MGVLLFLWVVVEGSDIKIVKTTINGVELIVMEVVAFNSG